VRANGIQIAASVRRIAARRTTLTTTTARIDRRRVERATRDNLEVWRDLRWERGALDGRFATCRHGRILFDTRVCLGILDFWSFLCLVATYGLGLFLRSQSNTFQIHTTMVHVSLRLADRRIANSAHMICFYTTTAAPHTIARGSSAF
jgi:hypothetical protein